VVLVSSVAVGGFYLWDSYHRYTGNAVTLPSEAKMPVAPPVAFAAYPGEVNMLITGTDECEEEFASLFGDRCAGSEEGARNDVTLLIHVPEGHESASVVSFPRDLLLDFPECTTPNGEVLTGGLRQINTAYDRGGLGCVAQVVEKLSGFSIPFAAKLSWGGVINITEKIGGVSVCVANGIYDRHTGLALDPGTHTLQGAQALQFLRTRYGLSDGSDLARISNQQLYMASLLKKLTSEGVLNDPVALLGIGNTVVNNVEHSTTLNSPSTLVQLALMLKELPLEKITFLQLPTVPATSDPNRVMLDPEADEVFWAALRGTGAVAVEEAASGAVQTPTPEGTAAPEPSDAPATPPVVSAPGMTAAADLCANGAG
jgi:LCP family protein required for cell wall assembly